MWYKIRRYFVDLEVKSTDLLCNNELKSADLDSPFRHERAEKSLELGIMTCCIALYASESPTLIAVIASVCN